MRIIIQYRVIGKEWKNRREVNPDLTDKGTWFDDDEQAIAYLHAGMLDLYHNPEQARRVWGIPEDAAYLRVVAKEDDLGSVTRVLATGIIQTIPSPPPRSTRTILQQTDASQKKVTLFRISETDEHVQIGHLVQVPHGRVYGRDLYRMDEDLLEWAIKQTLIDPIPAYWAQEVATLVTWRGLFERL